ncbi:MAG: ABC transporter ATP-binding protein [Actinomycetota bacterium]
MGPMSGGTSPRAGTEGPSRPLTVPSTEDVSAAATDVAVQLVGVSRLFGLTPALVRVDLRVDRGQVVLVQGPNGAGKTTLLKIVATILAPTYGSGSVLGFDLERGKREIRRRVEFLGHRTRLYADLTTEENLRFAASLGGITARKPVLEALDRVGLLDQAGERVQGLSQGMRQRLALARAFMRRPDLLLLDEPYAGLDEAGKGLVDWLVLEAGTQGRTVVLATHDLARAELLADRKIRLERGRAVLDAPISDHLTTR